VSKEFSVPLPRTTVTSFAPSRTSARTPAWLRSTSIVLAGSALVAVCAHLAVPLFFTPVPLSMAPFAVLVLGLLLSPRLAAATLTAYLIEGAAGLPVFAPTPAVPGLAHLFGPASFTGGYLLSYPLAASLIAFLFRRASLGNGRAFVRAALSATIGSLVILLCGALWLAVLTHASMSSTFMLAVLPFLPGDALKVAAAAGLAAGWARLRSRTV